MPLARGTKLGPYEILSPLGAGGMGEVYCARDEKLKRSVAIKVLPEAFSQDPDALARFEREALAVAALSHPNILAIHDFGREGGVAYAVMELLDGETLREKLLAPISPKQAVGYALQVAKGLCAAHEKGIVHRDLKPENLFVTKEGHVKILDFGLAKRVEAVAPSQETSAPTQSEYTTPGTVMGTVSYMSPEQVRGLPVDHRSDIFAFGSILYELLTGAKAFSRPTAVDTMAAILRDEPPDFQKSGQNVPPALERVVRHCLEKERDNRFQTARDIAFSLSEESLATLGSQVSLPAATIPALVRSGRLLVVAGLAAFAGVLAVAVILATRRGGTDSGASAVAAPREAAAPLPITSVAVLPFDNGSKDPDAEYLSDGLTESLIQQLSRIPSLKVMARATVFRFKGVADPLEAARKLKVGAFVTGSVARRGQRLNVSVELVEVETGARLWGERYDRPFADVLRVQDSMASDISSGLRLQLSGEEKRQLGRHGTEDAEAYALYLKGQYALWKDTEEGYLAAREFYRQAIARDPRYAEPHMGLSNTYGVMAVGGYERPSEAWALGDAEAQRALALNPSLAAPRANMAIRRLFFDREWEAGESELRRAAGKRGLDEVSRPYALYLWGTGRTDEAIRVLESAREVDPGNIVYVVPIADYHSQAGRLDKAIDFYKKAIEIDSADPRPYSGLAAAFRRQRQIPAAIEVLRKSYELSGQPDLARRLEGATTEKDLDAVALAATRAQLNELEELAKVRYISPLDLARAHALLGEPDAAFRELERAFADRSPGLVLLKADRAWDPVRGDPRFAAAVRRLRLP